MVVFPGPGGLRGLGARSAAREQVWKLAPVCREPTSAPSTERSPGRQGGCSGSSVPLTETVPSAWSSVLRELSISNRDSAQCGKRTVGTPEAGALVLVKEAGSVEGGTAGPLGLE